MAVFNIKDQRKSENETFCDVVLEIDNGDWQALGLRHQLENMTEWVERTSIYDAIMTACGFRGKVTIYLYSPGAVVENRNMLVAVHPGLKNDPITQSKIPPETYAPF